MLKPVAILLIILLCSCSSGSTESQFDRNVFPQEWHLIRITTSITGDFKEGTEMEFQESFILHSSGLFTKTRETSAGTVEGFGKYSFNEGENGTILELLHDSTNQTIVNCSGDLIELFSMATNETLVGSSAPCDGPILFYERVN